MGMGPVKAGRPRFVCGRIDRPLSSDRCVLPVVAPRAASYTIVKKRAILE